MRQRSIWLPSRGMWKNTGFRLDAMLPSVSALARHQSVTVISLPHADNACKLYLLLASLSLPAPSDPTPVFSLSRRGVPRGRNQIEFDLIAKSKKNTRHTIPPYARLNSIRSRLSALVHLCNHTRRCLCACVFSPKASSFRKGSCARTVAAQSQALSSLHVANRPSVSDRLRR